MLQTSLLLITLVSSFQDPIEGALSSFRSLKSYRVTITSRQNDRTERLLYYYKSPGFVRIELLSPHQGTVLVYDPTENKVRVRPLEHLGLFVLSLSPDNNLIRSARGHRVDESDVGSFLEKVQRLQAQGTTVVQGEEKLGRKEVLRVQVKSGGEFAVDGVHSYRLWLDKKTLLPAKTASYDLAGRLLEEVVMENLETNLVLDDGLFRL